MSQKLRLLKTGHGDLCLAEWDQDLTDSVAKAEEIFRENYSAGRMAFRLDGPGNSTLIKNFQKDAPEIILVPAIQGG